MPKLYKDKDVDTNLIKDKKFGIIGYGNQGRAQALNLFDSQLKVKIGLRTNSSSKSKVLNDGLECFDIKNLVKWADIISILIPDEIMEEVFNNEIQQYLNSKKVLLFSHGYNIHYKRICPSNQIDTIMVAPSGPGYLVREKFLTGSGIPNLIAVYNDYSGYAFQIALSYSYYIGGTKIGAFKSTFEEECETDLFGEQIILCGGIPKLIKMAFNTLVEAGYQPIVAWFVCFYEVKMIVDLFFEKGFDYMNNAISDTAEYGGYKVGNKLIDNEVSLKMKKILKEIKSGNFNQEWSREAKKGYKVLMAMRENERNSLIEKTSQVIFKHIFD